MPSIAPHTLLHNLLACFRVLSVGVLAFPSALAQTSSMGEPNPVRFTEAKSHRMRGSVRLPGSVESRKVSTVAGTVEGLIIDLPVQEGDQVSRGQVLAQLRLKTLELRLKSAKAQLQEDESRKRFSELRLKRALELLAEAVISQEELDDAQYEFDAWAGRLERLTAEIERIEDEIERSTIMAPFDGVVIRRLSEVGEWLDRGGAVVELLSLSDLEVMVEVPERYFAQLRPNSSATLEFDALPGVRVRARLEAVIPQADPVSRTFPVRLRLPASERRVGAGMAADAALPVGEIYDAVLVPKDAILTDGPRPRVYRISQEGVVESVSVELGGGVGDWVEVRGDLRAGDRVVTRGNERLFPGQKVKGIPQEYAVP